MRVLENQIVLITGARGGLGTDITKAFLKAGARVVGSSRKIADSDFAAPRFMGRPTPMRRASWRTQSWSGFRKWMRWYT
jgi:NAD(P)-dependent dehydrogenase (short-subunit alcohol dehydrogenase family)